MYLGGVQSGLERPRSGSQGTQEEAGMHVEGRNSDSCRRGEKRSNKDPEV